MNIELTLSNNGPLEFSPGLPSNYTGPFLPGAVAVYAKSNSALVVLQELAGEHYSIRVSAGRFLKRVNALGFIRLQGLYSYFMLKNGIRKEVGTMGKLHVREGQYTCFFTGPTDCKGRFEKTTEFRALDVFYSPKLLLELVPFFPELKGILDSSVSLTLPGKVFWALPSMKEITNQILNCPYDEDTRRFYFDLKVRELLYQMLQNAYRKDSVEHLFTPWEVAKIHEARTILEGYISKKPPSIQVLSRQVALNKFKLKLGFRQYFKTGIFEWLLEQRMQHAKHLVLTTNRPMKEICKSVGYPRTTNFITAFRRRFGMTPGSLRRK